MTALELINKLPAAFNPEAAAGIARTIQFNTSQPAYVAIRDGACNVTEGSADAADLTLTMADDDLVGLLTGKLNGVMALMTGKMKLQGDMGLAQQISHLVDAKTLA